MILLHAWREHFPRLLKAADNAIAEAGESDISFDDDNGKYIPLYDYNKATDARGLHAELFKCGGEELKASLPNILY